MAEGPRDKLLYKTAPSRLISAHLYLLASLLAALSGLMTFDILSFELPVVLGLDLNLYLPLFLATLALLVLIYGELKRITRRYMVFERRVARREGILSKRIQFMPYNKVERVELRQSIIKRLFGIGDIIIDTGEDSIVFGSIRRPGTVEGLISERLASLDLQPSPERASSSSL